jgi:hypothetical protein
MTFTRTRIAVLYALLAFTFFAWVINTPPHHGWIDWYRLTTSGRVAQATVTRLQPEKRCFFTYKVDSHAYEGSGSECTTAVGQHVPVTYSPSDPSFVSLQPPLGEFLFIVFVPLILSPLGGYFGAIYWEIRLRKRRGA